MRGSPQLLALFAIVGPVAPAPAERVVLDSDDVLPHDDPRETEGPLRDPWLAAPAAAPEPSRTSPEAVGSLVAGSLALVLVCLAPVLGLVAIALGFSARAAIARSQGRLAGRALANSGIALGTLAFLVFFALIGAWVHYASRVRAWFPTPTITVPSVPSLPAPWVTPWSSPPAAPTASASEPAKPPAADAPDAGPEASPAHSSATSVGALTVVDVGSEVESLARELREQQRLAAARGERLLVQTTAPRCEPCAGVARSLPDPLLQRALDHIRLVRVDILVFAEDLDGLRIAHDGVPGFFLLDADLRVTDAITGGEWDDDIAVNIAPVLSSFVRGTYTRRREKPPAPPRPRGTPM